jgi:hypothetical protein
MSYIGNTPVNQNFVAGADQFSGTGSQTVFTLSRNVNTVFDIFVTVSNVPQDPFTAYTVSGNTLTFDSAPPSGTNNIDVVYRATNVQTFVPSPGVSQQFSIGTAASPAITFIGDTNTGIYSPGADTLAFVEGGTEAMRIDSSANVGIGTTSPDSLSNFRFLDVGSSGTNQGVVQANNGTVKTAIYVNGTNGNLATRTNHNLNLQTNGSTRATIDTSGNFGVGTTTPGASYSELVNFTATATNQPSLTLLNTNGSFANDVFQIRSANTSANGNSWNMITGWSSTTSLNFLVRGNGNVLNSNNSYGSLSDQRLKENIVDATPKLEKLNQVRVVNFNMIGDEQKQIGVVAQELEQIFPGMIEEGQDGMKGVKYSVFVPMLIKAIQEQQQMIETLQAEVAALKGAA